MARKRFSARERMRLFELHGRECHICGQEIQVGEAWDLEHVVPWEFTRDDSDENVKPAHTFCHKQKTASDIKEIRKSDRVRAKHLGAWPKSKRPIPSRPFSKRWNNG